GEIIFDGRKIDGQEVQDLTWLRSHVGFVQQDPYGALAPFMAVEPGDDRGVLQPVTKLGSRFQNPWITENMHGFVRAFYSR
ncbi:MAG: hypothetical protein R6U98_05975, partial [Pirellulaceae bacterium]